MIVEQMLKNAQNPLLHIADVSGSALFQGDCLDIMPLIPDKSVQLILADLPYGKTKMGWDSIIPFNELWKQYERICADNCSIVLFGSEPFSSKLRLSNEKLYKYDWIWQKSHAANFIASKKMPLIKHENISVFYAKNKTYNPQMIKGKPHLNRSGKKLYERENESINGKAPHILENVLVDEHFPSTILQFSAGAMCKRQHPTEKPLELMKYLIKTYSNENDMVLDNTMGSGTTCLAAKELNRKFIGIEKEPKYYEIACQRCGF